MVYFGGGGSPWITVGFCSAIGAKKMAMLGAGIGGVIGGIIGYGLLKMKESQEGEQPMETKILYIGAPLLAGAGLGAFGGYFTCRGVRLGIPVKQR